MNNDILNEAGVIMLHLCMCIEIICVLISINKLRKYAPVYQPIKDVLKYYFILSYVDHAMVWVLKLYKRIRRSVILA